MNIKLIEITPIKEAEETIEIFDSGLTVFEQNIYIKSSKNSSKDFRNKTLLTEIINNHIFNRR
jgi:hypothetical protein